MINFYICELISSIERNKQPIMNNKNTESIIDSNTSAATITTVKEMAHPISEIKNNTPTSTQLISKKSLFRKNDPDTRYDENGTRYQSVAIPFRYTNNPKQPVL